MDSQTPSHAKDLTTAALEAAKRAADHTVDLASLPKMTDLTAENITQNVLAINSGCQDARMKSVFENLVQHLHDFVRESAITNEEWMLAIQFLTETGKTCTDIRQEFILLSDTLGVSALVDGLNNAKPTNATESTVLGPFFTADAPDVPNGESIATEGKGDYLWCQGRIVDTAGRPIANAIIDTWETDEHGLYDTQYSERSVPDCRGRIRTDDDGRYKFRAVVPVPYPIPSDGPVGQMVRALGRHVFRPAHLHFQIEATGFETLITALYFPGDPYLTSDAVFGVKQSLIEPMITVHDPSVAIERGFTNRRQHAQLDRDFVLATPAEGKAARKKVMGVDQ